MAFAYVDNELIRIGPDSESDNVSLNSLANQHTAPFYFYDGDEILTRAQWFRQYSRAQVHYAMKANSEINILKALARAGFGVDVVSFGEVEKALKADFPPGKVIYSGVAKSEADLTRAMELKVGQINVESVSELHRLARISRRTGQSASVALRMNLAMDVPTHPYIQTSSKRAKFGVAMDQLNDCLDHLRLNEKIRLIGLSAHIGSQITDLTAFRALTHTLKELVNQVEGRGFNLQTLDLGGGLGIDYSKDEDDQPRVKAYLELLTSELKGLERLTLILEPGRILTARPGLLVAKVEYVKPTPDAEFLILNTGTHHLLRPALYGALHRIQPLKLVAGRREKTYDVVGLLCESSDCFAKDYRMPEMLEGEWLAIRDAGAYGRVMASSYNESPLPREIVAMAGRLIGDQ